MEEEDPPNGEAPAGRVGSSAVQRWWEVDGRALVCSALRLYPSASAWKYTRQRADCIDEDGCHAQHKGHHTQDPVLS